MWNEVSGWRNCAIFLVAVYTFAPATLPAQSGLTDMGELATFGGGSFGVGAHPAVGGSSGVSFSRYGIALIEASYQPLGQHTLQSWPALSTVRDSQLWDFNLSFHIRVPVKNRWEPYGILGVGFLWNYIGQNAIGPQGNAVVYHRSQFEPSFVTGGGVRYYVRENWGIRPQLKVVVSTRTFAQLSFGIFYDVSNAF